MKKLLAILLSAVLMLSLLTGCRSNQEPNQSEGENSQTEQAPNEPTGDQNPQTETESGNATGQDTEAGVVKTGIGAAADLSGSRSAGEESGLAQYDIALAAVTVDDSGVITDCVIDAIHAGLDFDKTGAITSDLTVAPQTRGETKDDSGWHEQATALAEAVVGKTVDELKEWNIDAAGAGSANADSNANTDSNQDNAGSDADKQNNPDDKNTDANADQNGSNDTASDDTTKESDKQTSADATANQNTTVVNAEACRKAIEKAVASATHLGAQKGDELVLAAMSNWDKSAAATEEAVGTAQLDITMTALTKKDGVITSCVIDGLQAPVNFDQAGAISGDLNTELRTKNELGEEYGMKEYGGSKYEWNEQAAYFAQYVTGKSADEVKEIAVSESGAPKDEDLASTVTIKVGGFMELIEKAAR